VDTDNKGNIKVSDDKVEGKGAWPALHHPVAEMERVIDRFFGRGLPSLWRWEDLPLIDNLFEAKGLRLPTLDVIDRYADILVRAEIPGVDKKDINVSVTDNVLTIKAQSSREKEEKGDYYRREISSSSFARSVSLPGTVDASKSAANLREGILEITLPKEAPSRKLNIPVN
jgi:HSP20 family protein